MTVQYFDGCPNWHTALDHVHEAALRTGVAAQVTTVPVETEQDARRLGFTGSPTVLVNGTDPFAVAGAVPALACRVFATPTGLAGAPSVDQLVDALTAAA